MRLMICTALFLTFAGLTFAADKIDPAKLIGKWENKSPAKGETSSIEFTKDGNVKLNFRTLKGKDMAEEGTYKVEGDKLTLKVHPGNKKKTTEKVVTIDKLTDDEFVHTEDTKTTSFARVKAGTPDTPKTDTPKADAPNPDPLPKGTLPEADFKLSAGDYAKEFKKDEKAAQGKYKGKIVELSGTVKLAVGPALGVKKSSLSIVTPDPKDPFGPDVMCISDDPEFFARAGLGQTVRIKGKVGQVTNWLESSELVDRGPNTRIVVTGETIAKDFTADLEMAQKKYDDKTLVLSGTIAAIKPYPGLKINYVELKGDGKTVIECRYNDPSLVDKLKVGDTVKVQAVLTSAEKGNLNITNCFPLK